VNHPRLITSRNNPHFKRWRSLLDAHGIQRHHQCLASGHTLRREIGKNPDVSVQEILLPPSWIFEDNHPAHSKPYKLSNPLFQELDVYGTKGPLLVCTLPEISPMDLTQAPKGLEVVCPIGDPGNLGALLRCCRAFDVRMVTLLQEAVHPFHPKVIRASSGAVFAQAVRWGGSIADLNTVETLQWITALDLHGRNLTTVQWPKNVRLLIGEEGGGIPPFQFAQRLCIPQNCPSIPLNATVAGSIALYAYRRVHSHA
jgi:RNA methyltransferase, TrmH family